MIKSSRLVVFICSVLQLLLLSSHCAAETPYIPDQLRPWVEWVSEDKTELKCATVNGTPQCIWPSKIEIEASNSGARFNIHAHTDFSGDLALPYTDLSYPHAVEVRLVNQKGAAFLNSNGTPSIHLDRGDYEISGVLSWNELPETLNIPAETAIVRLNVNGKLVEHPHVEDSTIWLGGMSEKPVREADALSIATVRNVIDGAPFTIATALYLRVAGSPRQLSLPNFLPEGFVITFIDSSLSYQINPKGQLALQLIPGEHNITITAQSATAPTKLQFPKVDLDEWPTQEYVSWRADPSFRSVELSGGTLTDASRTELPSEWQQGSIYALAAGENLELKEQARGEQQTPVSQISLQRNIYLYDDANGYTASDHVNGFAAAPWRLDFGFGKQAENLTLGQVSVDGIPQVITKNPNGGLAGVELRSANLNLASTYTSDRREEISANGWSQELQSSEVNLHLPSGWRVIAAFGADSVSNTIVSRWSLNDLLVACALIATSWLLFGLRGAISMLLIVLVFQSRSDELSVTWITLILSALALKYCPPGRLRQLARIYAAIVAVCLLFMLPAFFALLAEIFVPLPVVYQFTSGLHGISRTAYELLENHPHILFLIALIPWLVTQLFISQASKKRKFAVACSAIFLIFVSFIFTRSFEQRFYRAPMQSSDIGDGAVTAPQSAPVPMPAPMQRQQAAGGNAYEGYDQAYNQYAEQALRQREEYTDTLEAKRKVTTASGYLQKSAQAFQEIDPHAVVQTGPGVPRVDGATVNLRWSNKVSSDQSAQLIYLSPLCSALLTLAAVLAVISIWLKYCKRVLQPLWLFIIFSTFYSFAAQAQEFPSEEMLNQLQQKIVNAKCSQNCLGIDSLKINLERNQANFEMRVSSQGIGAVALPGPLSEMNVTEVKILSSAANSSLVLPLRNEQGVLFARIPEGTSTLQFVGSFNDPNEATLSFSQVPNFIEVNSNGWQVDGLSPQGLLRGTLHLIRGSSESASQQDDTSKHANTRLAEWYTIDRSFKIGLNWMVTTNVTRSGSTSDAAGSVKVPLLAGESILTPGLNVVGSEIEIPFAYGQKTVAFESKIAQSEKFEISATTKAKMTEVWNLACSTIWQCSASGLNPTYSQLSGVQSWKWQPFPAEKVTLSFAKPEGAKGATATVDNIDYELTPSARTTEVTLRASVRESQSAIFSLQLSEDIEAKNLKVNGVVQSIRKEGNRILINLAAGASQLELKAQIATGWSNFYQVPPIKVGDLAVNISERINFSPARWYLLAGGDARAPIMLWWGKLLLFVLFAFGLSKYKLINLSSSCSVVLAMGLAILPIQFASLPYLFLYLLNLRARSQMENRWYFNLQQLVIIFLALVSALILWRCVAMGLAHPPNMLISTANNLGHSDLIWTLQRSDGSTPQNWLLSLPTAVWQGIFGLWVLVTATLLVRARKSLIADFSAGGWWR